MRKLLLFTAALLLTNSVVLANAGPPRTAPRPTTPSTKRGTERSETSRSSTSLPTLVTGVGLSLAVASGGLIGFRLWTGRKRPPKS